MDLKEFTSPLPKPWLNIFANSIHTPSGGAVSSCVYSQTGLTTIVNTAVQSSLSGNSAAVGSLTIGPLPVGAVVRLKAIATIQCAAGGFFPSLVINGTNAITHDSSGFAAVGANSQMIFESLITVLPANSSQASLTFTIPGAGYGGANAAPALLPGANTFDFQIRFPNAGATQSLNCITFVAEVLTAA